MKEVLKGWGKGGGGQHVSGRGERLAASFGAL